MDYCSQFWMPITPGAILLVEKLQRDFLNRVPALRELDYWTQLREAKMISIQRRLERYRILYVWKILEGKAPNCGVTASNFEDRQGRKCFVPSRNMRASNAVQTLKEQTFKVNGPRLFNSLPAFLRNMTKCPLEDFNMKLDKYLSRIPDEPSVDGLTLAGCTSEARPSSWILDQARRLPGRGERAPGE